MIKIDRDAPPKNTSMDKKKDTELQKIRAAIIKKEKPKFKPLWRNKVKEYLYESQYGKCCYCEQKKGEGETDVEHFRPKAQVKENNNHLGYWWLAYEWDNLLIACKICNSNSNKGTQFPLKDENKRAFTEQDNIKEEEPVLINPLTENPEDFIKYDIPEDFKSSQLMIKAVGKNARGDMTVNELTGINDKEALLARRHQFKSYSRLYRIFTASKNDPEERKEIIKEIKEEMQSSNPFAGLARYYFSRLLKKEEL